MRIAILGIRGIPAAYGGFETNAEITAKKLAEKGHEVFVYCRGSRKNRPREWNRINLIYLPSIEKKSLSTITHSTLSVIHCIFKKYDIVHLYNVGNSHLIPLLRLLGKRVVVSVDGVEWRRKKFGFIGSLWMRISERLAVWFSNRIIADSQNVGDYYRTRYDADTTYIPYGSNIPEHCATGILEKFNLTKKNYLLFVGRFIPEKGIDKLLKAYPKFDTNMPLVIVGDNPYDRDYVEYLKSIAPPNVIFPGAIYGAQVNELYANSYLFVSPSELEGTSPALLEAMGAGTCVVVNGIPEQLETIGDSGIYYKLNDLDDLVKKIRDLLGNPNLRDEFADRAQKRVMQLYRWDVVADKYEKLLLEIARR